MRIVDNPRLVMAVCAVVFMVWCGAHAYAVFSTASEQDAETSDE